MYKYYLTQKKYFKMKSRLSLIIYLFTILFPLSESRFLSNQDSNSQEVIFSKESGFYDSEFDLTLTSSENSEIYYTIDGSDPTNSETAQKYSEPIKIIDRTSEPNIYSEYQEDEDSPTSISRGTRYKKPPFNVDKAMVVRAVSKNSNGYGKILQHTYFITTNDLSQYEDYTIVSLITNPDNLFGSEKGIYVTGDQYIEYIKNGGTPPYPWMPNNVCNFFMKGSEWEREAYIEIFEKGSLSVQENVGIRIKGSSTRNSPQKNFNVYLRTKYGKKILESPNLFPDNKDVNGNPITEYDSFALRAISDETRARDQFSTRLIQERILQATTRMKNSYLFINGEFWGLYVITEKYSQKFFADHYNLNGEEIAYMKQEEPKAGSEEETNELIDFINQYSKKDLSDSNNYKKVCDYIDVDSLIEHYVTGIFLVIYDWPSHNYGLWKYKGTPINGNIFSDGKWRFMTYDLDYTMGKTYWNFGGVEGYAYDMFQKVLDEKDVPTNLFTSLLNNNEFKEKLRKVFEEYANDVATLDKANALINEYKENLTDMLANSQTRWGGYYGGTKLETFSYVKNQYISKVLPQIKKFFEERAKYAFEDLDEHLN